ncbi:MAG: DUF4159 domain-containing protein [Alphaproteobacteria bacterium]|jgi:hypothetical protein|nr:DUF4159 domain-containing protein [Alphaproteobacteria bacterium]
MLSLGALAFLSPWMLLGLVLLPVIWWLLRITPPTPRRQPFPPVRILMRLAKTEETPAATPLWLTLLRLLLAALVIVALARPTLNPRGDFEGDGALLLVVDDGWTAAAEWRARAEALDDLVDRAGREGRAVMLLQTAPKADGSPSAGSGLVSAAEARRLIRSMRPRPWGVDRKAALAALETLPADFSASVVWLSDGIEDGAAEALAARLAALGGLTVMEDAPEARAKAVLPPEISGTGLEAAAIRVATGTPEAVQLRLLGDGGRVLASARAEFAAGEDRATALLELPSELRNEAVRLDLDGIASAGSVVLLDERWRRRPVGLISGADAQVRAQPLLSALYYLSRAQAPFAEVRQGSFAELMESPPAIVALADIGTLAQDEAERLRRWIEEGGLLVRFAGPRLAQNVDHLVPVKLRRGGRVLGGAMTWSRPARIAAFAENSPFHGLTPPADVLVRRQVLAEPSLDLDAKTWARLADGTPLVTADRLGKGWLVLFHTTANTDWSNLPISGLFVDMLRRLQALSRGVVGGEGDRSLPPLASLDGEGRLGQAAPLAMPIRASEIETTPAGPRHPPGFYGDDDARRALNLTRGLDGLKPIAALPEGVVRTAYVSVRELELKAWLLIAALLLALVDLVASLALRGLLARPFGRRAAASVLLLGLAAGALTASADHAWAQARPGDEIAIEATTETHLAYVLTGDDEVDALSRAGLLGLSEILRQRTSVEAAAPIAVEVERDELAFYPLLYWPVTEKQRALSKTATERLRRYMRTGGTILFDTRDAQTAMPGFGRLMGGQGAAERLKRLLRRLDVPSLVPVPQEHVLTKAFYLMQSFPGRYASGRVWVELRPGGVNDGVSSIVIGSNDWAAAWAVDADGRPVAAVVPGGERQRELAYRFGVNLVMYTLTGNYKADQVHVPAILERLGQ